MKVRNVVVCVACLLGVAFAAKIKADLDKAVDFSTYQTYAWGNNFEPTRPGGHIVIAGSIEQQLEARGLRQTDAEHADIIVRYQAAGDTDMNFNPASDPTYASVGGIPLNGTTVWSPGFAGTSSGRYVRKGTLVIDIFDVRQRKLVWTASATDTIHEHVAKAIKQVGAIVASMFDRYPVKAGNRKN